MTNSDLAARPEPPGDQGSCDIFASIDRAELVEDPYPHLVVENALPQELIDTLLSAMPPQDVFTCGRPPGSNVRFALPSAIALEDSRASETWKTALRTCNAGLASLLAHFVRRLGGHLLRTFPEFAAHIAPLEDMRAVPRAQPARRRNEIGMDAQMVINTPALEGGTSVRGAHLDQPDKLIPAALPPRGRRQLHRWRTGAFRARATRHDLQRDQRDAARKRAPRPHLSFTTIS